MSRKSKRKNSAAEEVPVAVPPETTAELRRIANLFLITSLTLVLFLARAAAEILTVTFIPHEGYVVWGGLLFFGLVISFVYGVYVTFLARRWIWFALCLFPPTSVGVGLAYSWIRRQEIEKVVIPEGGDGAAVPQGKNRGKKRR